MNLIQKIGMGVVILTTLAGTFYGGRASVEETNTKETQLQRKNYCVDINGDGNVDDIFIESDNPYVAEVYLTDGNTNLGYSEDTIKFNPIWGLDAVYKNNK